jgi:ankyrin repeat protein
VERLLTAHPHDLDVEGGKHGAPLNAALAKGHLDIAQFLLDCGAVGDSMGFEEQTGLYIASTHGYADVVGSLIDRGANLNARCRDLDVDSRVEVLWTPLHAAIYNDHPDIALLLLERGANPETRSSEIKTALCMASSRGHADVVRSLINYGADLNLKSWDWMESGRRVKWTLLHAAIYKERRDIVHLLLECGSDPEIRSSRGQTALYVASSRRCTDIVRQLISHGADPNAECKTFDECDNDVKWTALHAASYHGRPEIAKVLLEHGANPNAPDHSGETALHVASEITVIYLLLEYGANVDVRDKEGWTPLHRAASRLKLQVMVVLLDRGADPHAQTNNGETPFQLANALHLWATEENQSQVIQLLSECIGERS